MAQCKGVPTASPGHLIARRRRGPVWFAPTRGPRRPLAKHACSGNHQTSQISFDPKGLPAPIACWPFQAIRPRRRGRADPGMGRHAAGRFATHPRYNLYRSDVYGATQSISMRLGIRPTHSGLPPVRAGVIATSCALIVSDTFGNKRQHRFKSVGEYFVRSASPKLASAAAPRRKKAGPGDAGALSRSIPVAA